MRKLLFLTVLLTGFLHAQDGSLPTEGLVAYYPFYENTNDASSNNYDGQLFGNPTLTQDRFGNENSAYVLDGVDDYIYFGESMLSEWEYESNGYIQQSFTISLWAKSTDTDGGSLVAFGQDEGCCYFGMITTIGSSIKMTSSNFPFYSNNSGVSSNGKHSDGQWHHYVLVWDFDAGNRQIYIDGVLAGQYVQIISGAPAKRIRISDYGIAIGRDRNKPSDPSNIGNPFAGSVDEIRIWNKALDSAEITDLNSYDNSSSTEILLNGTVSAQNNTIKYVADPTDAQDAATKSYVDSNVGTFYTKEQVDALISNLQDQINQVNGETTY
jgi:hypothetical protein